MTLSQSPTKIEIEKHLSTTNTWAAVRTAARLHMGFFDLHGGLGRQFGSIGLSIDAPELAVRVQKASNFSLRITSENSPIDNLLNENFASENFPNDAMVQRIKAICQSIVHHDCVAFEISALITPHAGLGSGTQLALAIGAALNALFGLGLSVAEIAQKTGRGHRSGIGIAAFEQGGLIIDGGRSKQVPDETPPILARYAFPKHWCVLLIEDATQAGIHGEAELQAFKTLPPFSENVAAHLCRHVLMQTMPAMMAEDLVTFGASIHALQMHVGDYFAPAQGGRYASRAVGKVLEYLLANNAPCVGQSSWGPTGFAVFENAKIAHQYLADIQQKFLTDATLKVEKNALTFKLCHANNLGAEITAG